jgi:phosphohistidine phosphatase
MAAHTLIIMRHAKSDWSTNVDDFDRPLNKRGHKEAKKMGAWLKRQKLVPDLIVSSPAKRAKQTIRIVCEQLGKDVPDIIWDDRIYETGVHDLLQVVTEHGKSAKRMLLTGHNPGLDHLVDYLVKDEPSRSATGKLMTTAAIAILDYGSAGISGNKQSAKLLHLARPKEI